jgi:hypothetical protein
VCWQVVRDSHIRLVRFLWAHHSSLLLDLIKNSADMVLPLSNLGNFPEFIVSYVFQTVLRNRDVPLFSIPDPGLTRSRIRILIKEFKYFQP